MESDRADVHSILHWGYSGEASEATSGNLHRTKLHSIGQPCVRFASENLRDLAVKRMVPAKLTALANACMRDSEWAGIYWRDVLRRLEERPDVAARA